MMRAGVMSVGSSRSASATCGIPTTGNATTVEYSCPPRDVCFGLSAASPRSLRHSTDPRRSSDRHLKFQRIVVRAQQPDEVKEVLDEIGKKDVDDTMLHKDAVVDISKSSETGDSEAFFEDVQADSKIILDSVDKPAEGGSSGVSRESAQQKLVDTAKDGIEVLKWAAEGVVNAGLNAKDGLGAAKELLEKRLKSFSVAVDETKEVSSQVAGAAQKKFGELQGTASKFSEEFQVTVEEKKAADSLKPESEVNPVAKAEQVIGENVAKATAEDGPISKLSGTLASGWEKVSKAGRDIAAQSAQKGEEIASIAGQVADEFTGKAKEATKESEKKN